MRVSVLENGLTRVFDDGSKLWGLYDTESGVHRAGFYFAPTLAQTLEKTLNGLTGPDGLEMISSPISERLATRDGASS